MNNEQIKNNIEKYGWHFLFVIDPKGEYVDFAYSIGFEESFNHPEILIFGLSKDKAHAILSVIAEHIKLGVTLQPNKKLSNIIGGEYEVIFKPLISSAYKDYLGTAVGYYGKQFKAMVMFWPDKSNILPTENGCGLTVQNEALEIV